MKRFLVVSAFIYLAVLLIGWIFIHFDQGSNWLVTLFLFSPRWVTAVPMALLVPLTMLFSFRWTPLYLIHAWVIAFPILGFQFSMPSEPNRKEPIIRVMTCNLGGGQIWRDEIVRFVREKDIHVLLLQECPTSLSMPIFAELGWHHKQEYNMAIGSIWELGETTVIARQPRENYEVSAAIICTLDLKPSLNQSNLQQADTDSAVEPSHAIDETKAEETVQLICLHLPTFRPALQKARSFDPEMGTAITEMGQTYRKIAGDVHQFAETVSGPLIIGGDFNIPAESAYYRDYWSEWSNAQDMSGRGLGYTKFTRYHGVRIDHLLVSDHWNVLSSRVGADFGGDHRPVITELTQR